MEFSSRTVGAAGVALAAALTGCVGIYFFFAPQERTYSAAEEEEFDVIPETLMWVSATTSAPWGPRDSHDTFVYQGKLWISGGLDGSNAKIGDDPQYDQAIYFNDIWSTSDGMEWNRERAHAAFPPARSFSVEPFKAGLFLYGGWSPLVGYHMGVWRSEDGVNWKQISSTTPWSPREGQLVIKHKGRLWMSGGVNYDLHETYNDVWMSYDGVNWEQIASSTPWASRWDHEFLNFNDTFYVFGGMSSAEVGYKDVWSSPDGVRWSRVATSAPWSISDAGGRQGAGSVVYKDRMWLVSGLDTRTNEGAGDTWYTEEGKVWKKAPSVGPWKGREDHAVILFDEKLFVLGGMNSDWDWEADVWYAEFATTTP